MPYTLINWVDHLIDPITEDVLQEGTDVNALNLNKMDNQIKDNETEIITHTALTAADDNAHGSKTYTDEKVAPHDKHLLYRKWIALGFNGTSTWVDIPADDKFKFELGDEITIEAEVNCADIGFTQGGILTNRPDTDSSNFALYKRSLHNDIFFYFRDTEGGNHSYRVEDVLSENTWHSVEVNYTFGTGASMEIKIDGVIITTGDWTDGDGNATPEEGNDPEIGSDRKGVNRWNGNLRNVKLLKDDGLVDAWSLDEGEGTVAGSETGTSDGDIIDGEWERDITAQDVGAATKAESNSSISHVSNTGSVTTEHLRQVNASQDSTASGSRSQVNASRDSNASNFSSQVNASQDSTASGSRSQVNASDNSIASNFSSQVNASDNSTASGNNSQVNASINSTASENYSQVNASIRVINSTINTMAGGHAASGDPSTANRKWEINSQNGTIKCTGGVDGSALFADYGEYLPNLTNAEIPAGTPLTVDGYGVRPVQDGDEIDGVVSETAGIRLNDTPFTWQGRYLHDEFGKHVTEEIDDPDYMAEIEVEQKLLDKNGKVTRKKIPNPEPRKKIKVQRQNPEFDITRENLPRSERKAEWTLMGMMGQVYMKVDKDVKAGDYLQAGDGIAVKASSKTNLKLMKITGEKEGYNIGYCLLR